MLPSKELKKNEMNQQPPTGGGCPKAFKVTSKRIAIARGSTILLATLVCPHMFFDLYVTYMYILVLRWWGWEGKSI
ncbi:hypothetical protein CPC08DRAFT_227786 [Agrocybe pediades]|nr:hypothetical protein CPC08DRAFT_227786 [Agrocybe pediades]